MIRTTFIQFPANVSGIGFQLKAADGSNIGSRVTAGIINVCTGFYQKQNVDTGVATLAFWTNGDGSLYAPDKFDEAQDAIKAVVYDTVAVAGGTLTLSTGATQVVTNSGRVTTP